MPCHLRVFNSAFMAGVKVRSDITARLSSLRSGGFRCIESQKGFAARTGKMAPWSADPDGQTGASSPNFELGACFPQLPTFVTNCEQRKLTNSIGGGSLYGRRARPYDSGSARHALPQFCRRAGRLG